MTTDSISKASAAAKLPPGVRIHGLKYQKAVKQTDAVTGKKRIRWVPLCDVAEGRRSLNAAIERFEESKAAAIMVGRPMTVDEMMRMALAFAERHEILEQRTLKDYRKYARKTLHRVFGKMNPNDVTPEHVRRFLWRCQFPAEGGRLRPVAGNREKSCLQFVYRVAIGEGWLDTAINPCEGVPRNVERRPTFLPDNTEIDRVIAALPEHIADVCTFARITGARQGDILNLAWSDIDEDNDGGITYIEGKTRRHTGKSVTYKWTPELRAIIDRARTRQESIASRSLEVTRPRSGKTARTRQYRPVSEFVFTNSRNEPMSQGWIANLLRKLKANFDFRELRPSAATEAENADNPQNLLGHCGSMRDRYHRHRTVRPLR